MKRKPFVKWTIDCGAQGPQETWARSAAEAVLHVQPRAAEDDVGEAHRLAVRAQIGVNRLGGIADAVRRERVFRIDLGRVLHLEDEIRMRLPALADIPFPVTDEVRRRDQQVVGFLGHGEGRALSRPREPSGGRDGARPSRLQRDVRRIDDGRADALEEEVKSIIAEPLPTKIVLEGGGRWIDSDLTDVGFANSVRAAVRNDDPIARMSAYAKLAFKIEDAVEGFERKVEKLKERERLAPGGTPESIVVHRKLEQTRATVRVLRLRFGKVIDRFYDLRRQNLRQILGASVALSDRYPRGNTAMRFGACRFPIENTLKLMIEQEMKTLKSKGVN